MLLTHLKLRNWRNFPSVDVPLSPRTFVYGPNASGKSNFLDVFRFLSDVAREEGGLQRAVKERNGFSAIRSLHAHGTKQQIEIQLRCQMAEAEWEYDLVLNQEKKTKRVVVVKEVVCKNGSVVDTRPSKDDISDPDRLRETHLESLRSNKKFRELAGGFASFSYMHLVPHVVKYPQLAPSDSAVAMGASLLERVAKTPPKKRDSLLKKVNKALKVALPQFEDLQFEKDPVNGTPHLKARYVHWRPQGGWQREDQFSDGTLRLLGLLWELGQPGSVLLLEEPELSLHSALVRQLPRVLAKVTHNKQVIFTSHSEELLEDKGVTPAEVLVLRPTKDGTAVTCAADEPGVRDVANADGRIGPVVTALTRPANAEQLALYGG